MARQGELSFKTPILFSIGFLVGFTMGGLTGVMLASPPTFLIADSTNSPTFSQSDSANERHLPVIRMSRHGPTVQPDRRAATLSSPH